MEIEIREVEGNEVPAIAQMLKDEELYDTTAGERSGLYITYKALLQRNENYVVKLRLAYLGEQPVGIASIEEPMYYPGPILNLFVKPPYRKRGIGALLLEASVVDGPFDVYHTELSRNLYLRYGFHDSSRTIRRWWHRVWGERQKVTQKEALCSIDS
jgi:GNAT superfamily N-acetyltransferase